MRRFFVETLEEGSKTVELTGTELDHMRRVLRLSAGATVALFNGRGLEVKGLVESIGKSSATVVVEGPVEPATESPVPVTLIQGLVKGSKPELIVQKAVELGAAAVFFYPAYRSVASAGDSAAKRLDRLRRVAVEAAKQCGRAVVPAVEVFGGYAEVLAATGEAAVKLILMERGGVRPMGEVLADAPGCAPEATGVPGEASSGGVVILIGPEGGLTDRELEEAAGWGFTPAGLGPRVLRAETAAIAAIAIAGHVLGDLGPARKGR